MSIGTDGKASLLSSIAMIDFYRGVPPGGFTKGLPSHLRKDKGEGDIAAETRGRHYFGYKPYHLSTMPPRQALAKATNDMQALAASGDYDGMIWTQGSPQIEESAYWFNLLIDTTLPICCNAAQRPQGQNSADGPANIVDSARFIKSRVWADEHGRNRCGVVLIQEQQLFAAREVAKVDARPGGYVATGGHGGIVGNISHTGRIALTYLPVFKHTYQSELRLSSLPSSVKAATKGPRGIEMVDVAVKDAKGKLLPDAIPVVTIATDGSYSAMGYDHDPALEGDLVAAIERKLGLRTTHRIRKPRPGALRHDAGDRSPRPPGQSHLERNSGCQSGARRIDGICRSPRTSDCRDQSYCDQGQASAHGLSLEVRQSAGGKEPR